MVRARERKKNQAAKATANANSTNKGGGRKSSTTAGSPPTEDAIVSVSAKTEHTSDNASANEIKPPVVISTPILPHRQVTAGEEVGAKTERGARNNRQDNVVGRDPTPTKEEGEGTKTKNVCVDDKKHQRELVEQNDISEREEGAEKEKVLPYLFNSFHVHFQHYPSPHNNNNNNNKLQQDALATKENRSEPFITPTRDSRARAQGQGLQEVLDQTLGVILSTLREEHRRQDKVREKHRQELNLHTSSSEEETDDSDTITQSHGSYHQDRHFLDMWKDAKAELKKLREELKDETDEEVRAELKSDIDGFKRKKDEWAELLGIKE